MRKKLRAPNQSSHILDSISPRKRQHLQRRIMRWYLSARRELPWRATTDPYAIWVSEVMLQQTQTVKVLEYYSSFLRRFPTVAALAAAEQDQVLKAWEGMGYYSRARNLQRAAKQILAEYHGELPREHAQLLTITGIGPYTAAAVASIAFNQNYAVLDGNVERVLSRIFFITLPPKLGTAKKIFQEVANHFLLTGHAKDWNQALMELGATICTPQKPNCASCPAQRHCRGYNETDKPEQLPVRLPKAPRPHHHMVVGLVWKKGKLFIDQREENGLLGGLWEFPGGALNLQEAPEAALQRHLREAFALAVEVEEFFTRIQHGFTHFTLTLHVYQCRYLHGKPAARSGQKWLWATTKELTQFAFPTAYRKIISALRQSE